MQHKVNHKNHFLVLQSFSVLKFKSVWRAYQEALLERFDTHIADNHFHVIAPPGSGKTILGIEILRRLGKRTLVLTPTLTIRDQWYDRLLHFFDSDAVFNAYSFDLKAPADITFITYQALHAFYKSFSDKEAYCMFFKSHGIETMVLDEAHHLKHSWWTSLNVLKTNTTFYVVALTATPPYDSSAYELSKYFELCGAIDDQIAVPDLVSAEDLCPHQDFVFLSQPEAIEIDAIVDYRQGIAKLKDNILADKTFINFISQHRFLTHTKLYLDDIYTNTTFFSALLIVLHNAGYTIAKDKLELLGFDAKDTIKFPDATLNWLQVLLQQLLVGDRAQLEDHEDYLMSLEKRLRRYHAFHKKQVDFIGNNEIYKSLTYSTSKLNSVVQIVNSEYKTLQDTLRCVVLTDYIRDAFLDIDAASGTINKIGVVPIFQYIKRYCNVGCHLAVLTGSLVIIHRSIYEELIKAYETLKFTHTPLVVDADFYKIELASNSEKRLVTVITEVFEQGIIKVLIGTKSLLGEGWDAPSINTLVLASFVGAFVSSNQMRGRAIRKQPQSPDKIANIWHLACLDPTLEDGGKEVEVLERRFEAFVGVSNTTTAQTISNGLSRLELDVATANLENSNAKVLERSKQRAQIKKAWQKAIDGGVELTQHIKWLYKEKTPYKAQQQIYYFDAVRFFIGELCIAMAFFYLEFILESFTVLFSKGVRFFIYAFLIGFFIRFGYKFFKALQLYLRHGYLSNKIEHMGKAILYTLDELGYLSTSLHTIKLVTQRYDKGDISCYLKNATQYENALFSKALTTLLENIDTPRYLIIKTSRLKQRFAVENFYAVPEIFGNKKQNAKVFEKHWQRHLGKSKLVYTRHLEGRKLLLKARLYHVHNAFKKQTKEELIWR